MLLHFLQQGSASDWSCHVGNQIWVALHDQYGISALISQRHFTEKPVVAA